jgi:UDP-GlcNAc:undecaprenyl-phosphate/decaprenyl-phosphate GlcNAc-1-phosphate transferase
LTGVWWEYLAVFVASGVLCAVLTPMAIRLAVRSGALDHPADHKSHKSPIPHLGGLAIVTAFTGAVVLAAIARPPEGGLGVLLPLLLIATALALVGLMDDLRELSPAWRVIAETGAAVVVWVLGSGVTVTGSDALNLILTVLWIVGITNAFNLLDNMDGLAAGLGAITCVSMFLVASANGQFLVAALAIGLAGCTAGFLRHNFHPASIYMGDSGALYIGFLIAVLGLKLRFEGDALTSALVPVLACSVAVFDTSLVVISRLMVGRSPFRGGRDHTSHRLVQLGLSVPVAVGSIYFVAASVGIQTFVISRIEPDSAWILAGMIIVMLLVGGSLFLRVPVYPDSQRILSADTRQDEPT